MAVTRKKAATPPKKSLSKTSNDGVVKRPARGFHRFRNGILNVTPKGGEMELVKTNQDSPLLRLPGELRSRIWEYALGGYELRSSSLWNGRRKTSRRMLPPFTERTNGTQLLRTCRQIYTETALLPYRTNTFICGSYASVKQELKYMKSFQRARIEKIQLELFHFAGDHPPCRLDLALGKDYLEALPGLKHIHVVAYYCSRSNLQNLIGQTKSVEAVIRSRIDAQLASRLLKSTCELQSEENLSKALQRWDYSSIGSNDLSNSSEPE